MGQQCPVMFVLVICLAWHSPVWAVEVAPRITDREIVEALTELRGGQKRLEEGQRYLQDQIKGLETRLTDTRQELLTQITETRREFKAFMFWGFGVTFAGMFALIGFVIWDRRSALAPAVTSLRALEAREARG